MRTSPNRLLALAGGLALALLGAGGLVAHATAPAAGGFVSPPGVLLLGVLEVDPLQSLLHLAIGIALGAAGIAGRRSARAANQVAGTVFLLLGLAGLFVVGTPANLLALNGAGNVLHFGTATLLLAVGLGAERGRR